jgi:hypothetical protein
MTTRSSTERTSRDLPSVHAAIAQVDELIDARRTLYRLAAELLDPDLDDPLDAAVVDSPTSRGWIGRALATGDAVACSTLVPVGAVATDDGWLPAGPTTLAVASRPEVNALLSDALAAFSAELARQRPDAAPLRLLTSADGERFTSAVDIVRDGIALARAVSPALVDDLLPHVSQLGLLDPDGAGQLGSASSRHFPGLVLLAAPDSAAEVAEALVHEGAHQKLFDLAITGAMLTVESDRCPPFGPSWPPAGRRWPMEQALAAGHAYACLDRFALDAAAAGALRVFGPGSLLPVARERSQFIGTWLLERLDWLGADAHTLLAGLHGLPPRPAPDCRPSMIATLDGYFAQGGWIVRRCERSDRAVVGRRLGAEAPEFFFVNGRAATLLAASR